MVEMTRSPATSSIGSQFNAFLFASIDEVAAEAPLSVVSVLARLDLDPWQEADELTQLPRETAVQRLAALLTKLPGGDRAHSDSHAIAQRLIALLPGRVGLASGWSRTGDGSGALVSVDPTIVMTLFILVSVIAMATLGPIGHPSPAPADAASAPGATLPAASPTKVQR
jgi:hypothetical protein